ncbi:MAG: zinc ribbon domain-containing protein, partial [Kiritimatiellaeota bacterium]|nr:zinc ribbon domain-containing protein [Kiritimatiellota bacterium]
MPLYEFYCEPCHTVFTFRAMRVDTETRPSCPVCKAPLKREVSTFAHIMKGQSAPAPDGADAPQGEGDAIAQRMEQVM